MLSFKPSNASQKDMTYDENGNLLTVTNGCGTTTYAWDVRNRLSSINGFNTDCSALSASFKYDALGRRIEKTVNGATKQYLYDGLDIVQEIEGSAVTANYIRTLNIDEPLARIKADGSVRYYQQDALGSVIALTDDAGAVRTQYSYDPFGGTTLSGEASDNPFQYTGRENDNTGLYYYRARYYSPELQRFISEDPIGFSGGINFYSYVGNNPINFTDPSGLSPIGGGGDNCCNGEWRGAASRSIYVWCICYWLCVPPGSVIWSGNWFAQPSTNGQLINAGGGKGAKRGDACLCKDPNGGGHIVPLSLSR
jgi:RHS repeat-associated protein